MMIGIICALKEETHSLIPLITEYCCEKVSEASYHRGLLFGQSTVLVSANYWGLVAAAQTTTTLLERYRVEQIIFIGVAGAFDPALKIGDVVIADQVYQHNMDASPLCSRGQIPPNGPTFFKTDPSLMTQAEKAADQFLAHDMRNKISPANIEKFRLQRPKRKTGTIASGDVFVKECTTVWTPDGCVPLAVEMEGAAIGQVCAGNKVPFVIIRIISDEANHVADIDFLEFVNCVASQYAEGIVEGLYAQVSASQRCIV